jgi:hypothetical protein
MEFGIPLKNNADPSEHKNWSDIILASATQVDPEFVDVAAPYKVVNSPLSKNPLGFNDVGATNVSYLNNIPSCVSGVTEYDDVNECVTTVAAAKTDDVTGPDHWTRGIPVGRFGFDPDTSCSEILSIDAEFVVTEL